MPFESRNDGFPRQAVRLLTTVVLVALGVSGPLLYFAAPHAYTQASTELPVWENRYLLHPHWVDWRQDFERHLRESSPVTGYVRGLASEGLFELGLLDSEKVHFGSDGWLFLRYGLVPDVDVWSDREPKHYARQRRRFLRTLHERLAGAGIELLVVVVPDKDRIYPEHCWPDGRLPPAKRAQYADLQRELAECGVQSFDGVAPLLAHKAAHPEELLFFPRDTHWTPVGARVMAKAVHERLGGLGWLARIGPKLGAVRGPTLKKEMAPDLVGMLGFRAGCALATRLAHEMAFEMPELPLGVDLTALRWEDALIALCGTSYSWAGFNIELLLELDRLVEVRRGIVPRKGPHAGLLAVLEAVRAGELRPKVIVWEFPERSLVEGGKLPDGKYFGWLYPPEVPNLR